MFVPVIQAITPLFCSCVPFTARLPVPVAQLIGELAGAALIGWALVAYVAAMQQVRAAVKNPPSGA